MCYWIGYLIAWLSFRLLFRLRVVGKENVRAAQRRGGVLIACNHESYFDPPAVGVAYRKKVAFLARKTLFKKSIPGWLLPRLNAIPVDQGRPDFTSLRRIIKELRSGKPVLIFPEGSRTRTGELGAAEAGVGLVIAKAGVPVLPMRISGAFDAFPRDAKWPKWGTRITLSVGDLIEFDEAELAVKGREDYQKIADKVMRHIGAIEVS